MRRWRQRNVTPDQHFGCHVHPTQPSVGTCTKCERNVCEVCRLSVNGTTYCLRCAMYTAGVSTRRP